MHALSQFYCFEKFPLFPVFFPFGGVQLFKTRVLPLRCPVKLFVTVSSFQSIPPVSASVALSIVCITKLNCVKFEKYSASLASISD